MSKNQKSKESHYVNPGQTCSVCRLPTCVCGECMCGHTPTEQGGRCLDKRYLYAPRNKGKGSGCNPGERPFYVQHHSEDEDEYEDERAAMQQEMEQLRQQVTEQKRQLQEAAIKERELKGLLGTQV